MKSALLWANILTIMAHQAFCQDMHQVVTVNCTINGFVYDYRGTPIPHARIEIIKNNATYASCICLSQYDGSIASNCRLSGPPDLFNLNISAAGYCDTSVNDNFIKNDTTLIFKIMLKSSNSESGNIIGYGAIKGIVIDSSGLPLPGATIRIESTDWGAASNINGEFVISCLPAGTYNVLSSIIGYRLLKRLGVEVFADSTTYLKIVHSPTKGEYIIFDWYDGPPMFDKYLTSNEWNATGDNISSMPVKNIDNLLETIPGFAR
jgi:hypothetical protein